MSKFLAEFKYQNPSIYEVEILKETEKTITLRPVDCLIGWMYISNGRMNKDGFNIFNTKNEAVGWLQSRATNQISVLKDEIDRMEKIIQTLGEI